MEAPEEEGVQGEVFEFGPSFVFCKVLGSGSEDGGVSMDVD
jgi:hypothetical protein